MRKSQIVLAALVLVCATGGIALVTAARGPDFQIELDRKVPSKLSPAYLDQALNLIRQWPAWYFSGAQADQVDEHGKPLPKSEQRLKPGAYIRIVEDTKRGFRSRYSVTLQVLEYDPGHRLSMRVVADSKNNLTRLFDPLDWTIELVPRRDSGTWILGKAQARTRSWRARIFGKFAPKILLNQVFYPNLFVLAEINNPDVVVPDPNLQHGGM